MIMIFDVYALKNGRFAVVRPGAGGQVYAITNDFPVASNIPKHPPIFATLEHLHVSHLIKTMKFELK